MKNENKQNSENESTPLKKDYSSIVIDTMYADTISRGMQNAVTLQQNTQMANSSSITNTKDKILDTTNIDKKENR